MKKFILSISLLCSLTIFGQDINKTSQDNDVITNFMRLSSEQLFDTAMSYYSRNSYDTALICYNLIINTIPKNADIEQQKILYTAFNMSGIVYAFLSDYSSAYNSFIKALLVCEKINDVGGKSVVYQNLGIIYRRIGQHDLAKQYYLKALDLCTDSINYINIINNLATNEIHTNNPDSAFYYLNKTISISKRHNSRGLGSILNNFASCYQQIKLYDSALYYFRLSLEHNKKINNPEVEATNLSEMGNLFFKVNKIDSALYYISLSNKIASQNKFLKILSDNYLTLSEIEKSKGKYKNALELYETYINLKDSIYNAGVFGGINQMQRLYEISKTNQQIEELMVEKQIKERTILYQNFIFGFLILLIIVLFVNVYQKKKLNKTSKVLVEKNIEMAEVYNVTPDFKQKKYSKKTLIDELQKELLNKILLVMEDTTVICDAEFSINKLAKMVQSNYLYVSDVINDLIKKNFRSFLNEYRIKEAQRIFSAPDTKKYTIESIAQQVGFKSPNAFRKAFKDINGVNPLFYIKMMKEGK